MCASKKVTTVNLNTDEVELLVEACSVLRDKMCVRPRWECARCKKVKECETISELELRLQGK